MRKILSLALVFMFAVVLGACANTANNEGTTTNTNNGNTVEVEENVTTNSEGESTDEADTTVSSGVGEVNVGEIAKVGVGHDVSIAKSKAKAEGTNPTAEVDAYVTAVAFDSEGKIVDVILDVAQGKMEFDENLVSTTPLDTKFDSKVVLGDEYGMKRASQIGKEWYEQADAFEQWAIGKTADEILNMNTVEKDEAHQNVPDEPDLVSSVTIDVGIFQKIIGEAWDKSLDVEGVEKIGLGLQNNIKRSKNQEEGTNAKGLFEVTIAALALDEEGKIVESYLDMAMAETNFDAEGNIVTEDTNVGTKQEIKEEYGMKAASSIDKEWYEQANSLSDWMEGKTPEEIVGMEVKEKDPLHPAVPTNPDLVSSVTITVEEILPAIELAAESAK